MVLLSRPTASSVQSVVNWMDGNKPLVRSESMYLDYREDLVSLATADDHTVFDELIEWLLIKIVPKRLASSVRKTHNSIGCRCLLTEFILRFFLQRFDPPLSDKNNSSFRPGHFLEAK